jgi:hypothetical protein
MAIAFPSCGLEVLCYLLSLCISTCASTIFSRRSWSRIRSSIVIREKRAGGFGAAIIHLHVPWTGLEA